LIDRDDIVASTNFSLIPTTWQGAVGFGGFGAIDCGTAKALPVAKDFVSQVGSLKSISMDLGENSDVLFQSSIFVTIT